MKLETDAKSLRVRTQYGNGNGPPSTVTMSGETPDGNQFFIRVPKTVFDSAVRSRAQEMVQELLDGLPEAIAHQRGAIEETMQQLRRQEHELLKGIAQTLGTRTRGSSGEGPSPIPVTA